MMPLHDSGPKRILVVALLPIGDTLFATPTLRALKRAYPDAHLTAVAYAGNRDILANNPNIDRLLVAPTRQGASFRTAWELATALRSDSFDLGIGLNPFLARPLRLLTRTTRWLDLPLPPRWWLTSHRSEPQLTTPAIISYLQTLTPLGLDPADPAPEVFVAEDDRRWAQRTLQHHGVVPDEFLLALHPGGEGWGGIKRWSPASFAWVAQELIERFGGTVLLVGGKGERSLTGEIAARLGERAVNAAGEAGLMQSAALLEQASLFVGNDSGPLHLAAAVGTPAVGIYGPSNAGQFAPPSPNAVAVTSGRNCAPCLHFIGTQALWDRPWRSSAPCLGDITPQQVVAAALSLLTRLAIRRTAA